VNDHAVASNDGTLVVAKPEGRSASMSEDRLAQPGLAVGEREQNGRRSVVSEVHKTTDDRQGDMVLRTLRRTRQIREFTDHPVDDAAIRAILEVARWTGSGANRQPWTFVIVHDAAERQRIAEFAPHASHVSGAPIAIAIVMDGGAPQWDDYDEGRVAERILIAATALGLGGGIGLANGAERVEVAALLGVRPPAYVRTMISLGHPTEASLRRHTGPGTGRRPFAELVSDHGRGVLHDEEGRAEGES
jgi:nitroreductase